jgi:hypothetical protein
MNTTTTSPQPATAALAKPRRGPRGAGRVLVVTIRNPTPAGGSHGFSLARCHDGGATH